MKKINVLHVGHSPRWRGGENQVRLLIERMNELDLGVEHYLAYPKEALIFERLKTNVSGNLQLASESPIDPRSIWAIFNYCKKNNITVLHAQSGNGHTLCLLVKKLLPNIKLVVHRRINKEIKTKATTKKKFLTDKVDHFIAISHSIAKIMINYGIDQDKLSMIYDAVDDRPYLELDASKEKKALTDKYSWNAKIPLLGFVAALESEKNPQLFIEALYKLKKKNIQFNAIIAGSGKQQQNIEDRLDEYGLNEQVKMLGFVKNTPPLFAAIDIFVLPSKNEGLGTVLLEAALAQSALVASNVGGISEIIIDQNTGCLVDHKDKQGFSDAIENLINNDVVRKKLIQNVSRHVGLSFSLDRMAKETADVYKKLS